MNDGSADPVDWSQFYENMGSSRLNRPPQSFSATTAGPTMPISTDVAAASGSHSKPARKRSRTSKRAPTTLLNTNTSNFRAMVQQFTGVPSTPYTNSYMAGGATTLNFGIGFNNTVRQSAIMPSFEVLESRQNQHQYQPQQQQQQHHEERYMLPQQSIYRHPPQQEEMMGYGIGGGNLEDDRRQAVENSREVGLGFPEEFFLDGIDGQVNPRSENSSDAGYFL